MVDHQRVTRLDVLIRSLSDIVIRVYPFVLLLLSLYFSPSSSFIFKTLTLHMYESMVYQVINIASWVQKRIYNFIRIKELITLYLKRSFESLKQNHETFSYGASLMKFMSAPGRGLYIYYRLLLKHLQSYFTHLLLTAHG